MKTSILVVICLCLLGLVGFLLMERQSLQERQSVQSQPAKEPPAQSANVPAPIVPEPESDDREVLSVQEKHDQIMRDMEIQMEEKRLQAARESQVDMTRSYLEQRLTQEQKRLDMQERALQQQMLQQQQQINQSRQSPSYYVPPVQVYNFDPNPYTDAARARAINSRTDQYNRDQFIQNKMPHRAAYERRVRERD